MIPYPSQTTEDPEKCRCGFAKLGWQSFCACCYARLPSKMIDAINQRRPGSYAAATAFLAVRDAEQEAKRAALRVPLQTGAAESL